MTEATNADLALLAATQAALDAGGDAAAVIAATGTWLAARMDERHEGYAATDVSGLHDKPIQLGIMAGRRDEAEDVAAAIRRYCGVQ